MKHNINDIKREEYTWAKLISSLRPHQHCTYLARVSRKSREKQKGKENRYSIISFKNKFANQYPLNIKNEANTNVMYIPFRFKYSFLV